MNEDIYCIDIHKICDVKGLLHVYFIDINNILVACNKLKLDFCRDLYGREDVIGKNISELLSPEELGSTKNYYLENMEIIKSGLPKQYYNTWVIKDLYRLELLTFRFPISNKEGKVMGILTVSHFMNKFSLQKAYQCGLSKRETECLFYLLDGCTAKEIAVALHLSHRTVEGYIENMKNKLGCSTASELIVKVLQNEISEGINSRLAKNILLNNKLHSPAKQNIANSEFHSILLDSFPLHG